MTDKQIIIDGVDIKDCKRRIGKDNFCRYYKRPCAENNYNCIWKKYLRKEKECEKLKTDNATLFDKAMETRKENTNMQVQLYQLKAENKLFRTCHDNEQEKRRKYEQTLTEIKEITKENIRIADLEGLNSVYRRGLATQILQKIRECEVEDER